MIVVYFVLAALGGALLSAGAITLGFATALQDLGKY